MLKLPMWLRIILGALSLIIGAVLSWAASAFAGSFGMLTILPFALFAAYLNPELMRGD